MCQESGPQPIRQSSFVDGHPSAGTNRSTTADVIAARLMGWAATHRIGEDAALILNLRSVIEGALSEYFRFLSCDGSLMVFNHSSSDRSAMLLILAAEERRWHVAYKNDADASDVTRVTLGKLLDNAQNPRLQATTALCPGWTYSREDLPLNAFICSKLQVPFSVKVMEYFYVMRPLPGQRICPQTPLLRELAEVCDDLPVFAPVLLSSGSPQGATRY